ncbi:unnamed protein product [Soboliphyme baturini]|uniref:Transthyretin-like protein 46 n=1 Tax=Soboliphyme baturini TaxID=241478 RepID=A0A183IGZ2_9BILA|nr:unnamed protein product [Soboliphyme baturini]
MIDITHTGGPDDTMDEARTNSNGEFSLDGQTSEMTTIDPVVKIYHDCNDAYKPCQRRWKMDIPKKYVGTPSKIPAVCDIGVLNLEVYMHDEERNCI